MARGRLIDEDTIVEAIFEVLNDYAVFAGDFGLIALDNSVAYKQTSQDRISARGPQVLERIVRSLSDFIRQFIRLFRVQMLFPDVDLRPFTGIDITCKGMIWLRY